MTEKVNGVYVVENEFGMDFAEFSDGHFVRGWFVNDSGYALRDCEGRKVEEHAKFMGEELECVLRRFGWVKGTAADMAFVVSFLSTVDDIGAIPSVDETTTVRDIIDAYMYDGPRAFYLMSLPGTLENLGGK